MAARVLVAFASKLGSTAEIAGIIAGVLTTAGIEAEAMPVRSVRSLEGYDAVILGSALYAAHWQRDANRFVAKFGQELVARPLWLFSSGPLDAVQAAANLPITAHAAEITVGLEAREHRTFGGRLAPDAPIDPQVLRTHPIGDFRDWDAITAWTRSIAATITRETTS
ncbi:MAG: flavodoxin domain-containing protein [Chloroflexota bacterium]